MDKEFIDFKVTLIWHKPTHGDASDPGKLSAEYECLECSPPLKTSSTPIQIPKEVASPKSITQIGASELITEGEGIANIVLPTENNIRKTFQNLYDSGKKIRLRLTYPHNDIAEREEQIEQIAKIRWETINLSKAGEEPSLEHCLCLRKKISIVHCLRNPQEGDQRIINQLPVKMVYISRLGNNSFQSNDRKIYDVFEQRVKHLDELFILPTFDEDPDPFDVIRAFQDDHFVHLTAHGVSSAFQIDQEDVFTEAELLMAFRIIDEPKLKALVLLCCNSAAAVGGLSAALHQKAGIPVVVGTTGPVPIPSAERFIEGFYEAIGQNPNISLENAVTSGRVSVLNQATNTAGENKWDISFCLPRIFLNGSDSTLIPRDLLFGSLETMVSGFDTTIQNEGQLPDYEPANPNLLTLINWITQKKDLWYLVTGLASSDKRRLIACLLHELKKIESPKIIYHFCQVGADEANNPLAFIRYSLIPQLVRHYKEAYKARVLEGRFPLRVGNEDDALRDFVIEPLSKLIEDKVIAQLPVIVIDGIDVMPRENPNNTILDLLLRHRGDLEKVARFLVTADYDPDLDRESAIIEDIHRLTNHHRDGRSDLSIEKPEDPLVLFIEMEERLTPLFSKEPLNLAKSKKWDKLDKLFDCAIMAAEQNYGNLATHLLDVVTVCYEPLHANDVATILELQSISDEMEQFRELLPKLQPFFKDYKAYQDKLILYHDKLKTYLLLNDMNWWNRESAADTHELFVKAFAAKSGSWAGITNWRTLSGTRWPELSEDQTDPRVATISRYARRYLSHHAYYSYYYTTWQAPRKRRDRATEFLNLIWDARFRDARLNEVGRREAVQDIWLGLRVINTEYIHHQSEGKSHQNARIAFDRLLAADRPNSYQRNKLVELEQDLRNGRQVGWEYLFEFLRLDTTWWKL